MDDPLTILDLVKPCLSLWQIELSSIELISHSENIVYKATAVTGKQYAVRVHRPGYSSYEELISEQLWTTALKESGINVPAVIQTESNQFYQGIEVDGVTRFVGVIEWMEGQPLAQWLLQYEECNNPPTSFYDTLFALGGLIAKTHNQAASWKKPAEFVRRQWNVDGLLGESPHWGPFWEAELLTNEQRDLMSLCRQYVTAQLSDYGMNPDKYSMIHADLHAGNVMVSGNGMVLIDFDDAGYGWHLYDIAVAIHNYQDRTDFEKIKDNVIEGYRNERKLDQDDVTRIPHFLLMRSLASIGWVNDRPELNREEYTAYLVAKVEVASRQLGIQ